VITSLFQRRFEYENSRPMLLVARCAGYIPRSTIRGGLAFPRDRLVVATNESSTRTSCLLFHTPLVFRWTCAMEKSRKEQKRSKVLSAGRHFRCRPFWAIYPSPSCYVRREQYTVRGVVAEGKLAIIYYSSITLGDVPAATTINNVTTFGTDGLFESHMYV
jgi:hypothetical protein